MKFEASFLLLLGACVAVAVGKPQNLDDEEVNSTKYTFATASQNVTAKLGDTVKIDCDVQTEDGKPVAADQQEILTVWLVKGAALFAGTTKLTRDRRMSLTGRSLVIADVREADAGEYMCQLTTWGEPRLSQHLVIQLPPTIKAVKDTIIAKDGDDVILECVAAGSPEPSITWKAKGETLSVTGRTLTLEQVSLHQAGVYTCEASNGVGGPVSSQIKLEVMYKPVIKIDKSWIHSGENNQAELTCIIGGQPAPTVTWLKDGVELDSDSEHWSQRREEGADIYVLELKNLKRDHFGTYQCRAENSLGSAEGMIELSGIAHRVEFSSPPNGKKPDSYLLKWTVESYSPVKEYTIKYRKVKANATTDAAGEWATLTVPGDAELKGAASHKHTKEFMLRNLSLATEYEVSVQVTNVFGSNTPSTFKFATLGSKVAAPTTAKGAQKEGGASLASPSWITLAVVLGAMAHASLAPVFLPARLI